MVPIEEKQMWELISMVQIKLNCFYITTAELKKILPEMYQVQKPQSTSTSTLVFIASTICEYKHKLGLIIVIKPNFVHVMRKKVS